MGKSYPMSQGISRPSHNPNPNESDPHYDENQILQPRPMSWPMCHRFSEFFLVST